MSLQVINNPSCLGRLHFWTETLKLKEKGELLPPATLPTGHTLFKPQDPPLKFWCHIPRERLELSKYNSLRNIQQVFYCTLYKVVLCLYQMQDAHCFAHSVRNVCKFFPHEKLELVLIFSLLLWKHVCAWNVLTSLCWTIVLSPSAVFHLSNYVMKIQNHVLSPLHIVSRWFLHLVYHFYCPFSYGGAGWRWGESVLQRTSCWERHRTGTLHNSIELGRIGLSMFLSTAPEWRGCPWREDRLYSRHTDTQWELPHTIYITHREQAMAQQAQRCDVLILALPVSTAEKSTCAIQ